MYNVNKMLWLDPTLMFRFSGDATYVFGPELVRMNVVRALFRIRYNDQVVMRYWPVLLAGLRQNHFDFTTGCDSMQSWLNHGLRRYANGKQCNLP